MASFMSRRSRARLRNCCWFVVMGVSAGATWSCSDVDADWSSGSEPRSGAPHGGATTSSPPAGGSSSIGRAGGAATSGKDADGGTSNDGGGAGDASAPEGAGGESNANGSAGTMAGPGVAGGTGGPGGAGEGGADGAGEGGVSGAAGAPPEVPPAGAACVSCGAAACGSALTGCQNNPECSPWLACIAACNSSACTRACDARYGDVARVYYGVYSCLCGACADSCQVAESCQKSCVDDGRLPPSDVAPATLAETGLYASPNSAATVAPNVYLYEAKFPLWADGAGKDRYIFIPRCSTIDTKDMDHWEFPVGTRLWKHFSVDGKRVETRMIHRYGSNAADWLYATYGWDDTKPDDPRAAVAVLHGEPNANGTLHDIPDPSACPSCHGKLPEKPLGFSAFQLSHTGVGLNMQRLSDWGMLSVPARNGFAVPGTPVQQAALGYLHGNCGGCHNESGQIPRENPMKLRLLVAQTKYAETDAVLTTIGVPTINTYPELHDKPRIDPGAPDNSAIYLRMSDRNKFPMPPLATKFADTDGGVAAVTAWINSLAN